MRELWRIVEACRERKMMVRVGMWPGGAINVAIYDNEVQQRQHTYDADSLADIEMMVLKDFAHLLGNVTPAKAFPSFPKFPKL